jgi:parallel beta-helix repeat protein
VTNSTGSPVSSASVSTYNNTWGLDSSALTNNDGLVRYAVTEYTNLGGTKYYANNITVNATKPGYTTNSSSHNLTIETNLDLNFTIDITDGVSTCQVIDSAGYYILTSDVSSDGTCFNITSDDVILDCQMHTITYSLLGASNTYGVYSDSYDNTMVKNCVINDGNWSGNSSRHGIYFSWNSDGIIYNNTINVSNGYGIYANYAGPGINITQNTVSANATDAVYGRGIYNSFIVNNTLTSMNGIGLFVTSGTETVFEGNMMTGSSDAFSLNSALRAIVKDNTINGVGSSGLHIGHVHDSQMYRNNMTGLWEGIEIRLWSSNNTFTNNTFKSTRASGGGALRMWGYSRNNIFINNNFSGSYFGLDIYAEENGNTFINNTITSNQTNGRAIQIGYDNNYVFIGNTIVATGSGSRGVNLNTNTNNILFQDNTISGVLYDVSVGENSINTVFLNTTYNKSKEDVNAAGDLYRKWWLSANVTNSTGSPVVEALVSTYNNTWGLDDSALTDNDGLVRYAVTEYKVIGGTKTYQNNITVNVTKQGYTTNSSSYNLTNETNLELNITFDISNPVSICQVISSAGDYLLINNVSSDGTCFTINADNVTLYCDNHQITYSLLGAENTHGILSNNSNNVIIKDCNIVDGNWTSTNTNRTGILSNATNNNTFFNIFVNASRGAFASYNSVNLNITSNQLIGFNETALGLYGGSDYAWIFNNTFQSMHGAAGNVSASHNSTITNNDFISNSSNALNLLNSHNATITNNNFTSNTTVISINNADTNVLHSNTLISGTQTSTLVDIDSNSENNILYYNTFTETSSYYVDNEGAGNEFNTTVGGVAQGNYYYNILSLNIFDSSLDGWGDSGSDYPFNATTSPSKWSGIGADFGPATENANVIINFVSPTPDDNEIKTNVDEIIINISVLTTNLNNFTWNWNGTNHTVYDDSLLLMMNFDNVSALGENDGFVRDLSLQENDGTIIEGVITQGIHNNAINFSGGDTREAVELDTTHVLTGAFTLSYWFNTNRATNWRAINSIDSFDYAIWHSSGTSILFGGAGSALTISESFETNTWEHITITRDSSNNVIVYRNGENVGSRTWTGELRVDRIGGRTSDTTWDAYDGLLDEVRLWNKTLTSDAVKEVYKSNFNKYNETQWYFTNDKTGLDAGNYTYYAYAENVVDNNQTETRTLEIIVPNTIDACQNISNPGVYHLSNNISSNETCITIETNNVVLDCLGHTITYSLLGANETYGVQADANNATIQNCIIQDGNWTSENTTRYAIYYPWERDNGQILNNKINVSDSHGIYTYSSNNMLIQGNNVTARNAGVWLRIFSNGVVENNIVIANRTSGYAFNAEISNSNFSDTAITNTGAGAALGVFGSDNAIERVNATTVTIQGLFLYQAHRNNLSDIIASSTDGKGVELQGSDNNTLMRTQGISSADAGIMLNDGAENNIVEDSQGISNTSIGVWLYNNPRNNTLINVNGTSNNSRALDIALNSYENVIRGGTYTSNNTVVWIRNSYNNTLYNNTFISGTQTSTLVDIDSDSENNTLYHNNFTETSSYYVDNEGAGNEFNTTIAGIAQGNYYYNITSLNIFDFSGNGWGDSGSDYPLNSTTWPTKWLGLGNDFGPATNKTELIDVRFISPTPDDEATVMSADETIINTSIITNTNLTNFTYNWNGTNYTFYDESLVLMMNFDNRSSLGENDSFVYDASPYENQGDVNGAQWINDGVYGGAYSFDGSSNHITLNESIHLESVSLWVNFSAITTTSYFLGGNSQGIRYSGTNFLVFNGGTGWTEVSWTKQNDWVHFAAVHNGSGNYDLYINSEKIGTSYAGDGGTIYIDYIGRRSDSYYFDGTIDEVMIWNRSLTENEIQELYKSNLYKYNETQWYFTSNKSGLDEGNYTYNAFAENSLYDDSAGLRTLYVIDNTPPNNPVVNINSTNGYNLSNDDLNCFANITDPDGDNMNISLRWYRDNSIDLSLDYNNYANGTSFTSTLNSGNTTKGDSWICSMRLFDGEEYSEWVNSTTLVVLNTPPSTVNLITPENNNDTVFEVKPLFNWSDATDDDEDTITYNYMISMSEEFSSHMQNITNIENSSYAWNNNDLAFDTPYYWRVRAFDGEEYGEWSSTSNFTIQSQVIITLLQPDISFGLLAPESNATTEFDSPLPFKFRNDGNVKADLYNTSAQKSIWDSADLDRDYWQIKVRENATAFNTTNSILNWINVSNETLNIISALNIGNITEVDTRVSVPFYEPPGDKNSTIIFDWWAST